MSYIGTQPNDVKKNTGLYTPSEILQLTKDGSWGGSLELIEEKSISSVSSAIFTDIKEAKYNVHFLAIDNHHPSDDTKRIRIRFFENGVEETASVYQVASQIGLANGSFSETRSTGQNHLRGITTTGNATNESGNAYIYFYNLGDSAKYSFTTIHNSTVNGSTVFSMEFGGGVLPQASTVDQIKLYVVSGTFSATAKLYGVKQI
jgi:hypothetical protein